VLAGAARDGRPASVLVVASGRRGFVLYSAPATLGEDSIEADLGPVGTISVAYRPTGGQRSERSRCGDKPVSFADGWYEGRIDFHGEEGFAEVETTRARGSLQFALDLVCAGAGGVTVSGNGPGTPPGAELDTTRSAGAHLKVVKNGPRAAAHFEASASERRGAISILRAASVVLPAASFRYDPLVRAATVGPPAPFSGSARFDRGAAPAKRWRGNLRVDLPGRAEVPLTGSGIEAKLAHSRWSFHGADVHSRPRR
jgi:hypothetical protein